MKTPREKFIEIMDKMTSMDCATTDCKRCIYSSRYNKTRSAGCGTIRPIVFSGAKPLANRLPSNNIQKILQRGKVVPPDDLKDKYMYFCRRFPSCSTCPLNDEVFKSIGMPKYASRVSCEAKFAASILCGIDPEDWTKGVIT